jgi:PqqD family protein of HPr-rel-A system
LLVIVPALSTDRFKAVTGLRIAQVGHLWVAFSPLSGETTLLNDEAAAVLELIGGQALTQQQLCKQLAADTGQDEPQLASVLDGCWGRLMESGLVDRVSEGLAEPVNAAW